MINLTLTMAFFAISLMNAQIDSLQIDQEFDEAAYQQVLDSINTSFTFQTGEIDLGDGLVQLHVPTNFKFLDKEQSNTVLVDLWGNPPQETLGMLFPENSKILGEEFTYAIEITYSEDGYVDDSDAKDIDYDDLLEEMQKDTNDGNEARRNMGYAAIEMVGWAAEPFYDENAKKLHWAKELHFEGETENTLNYNIRILGRKGYLNMNAISDIQQLHLVQQNIEGVINSVEFNLGNRYSDFNPDFDEVAAYGIGGLVAGKVLAKAGFFAMLLKFWKFIAIGAIGLFGAFKKRIFGSKDA